MTLEKLKGEVNKKDFEQALATLSGYIADPNHRDYETNDELLDCALIILENHTPDKIQESLFGNEQFLLALTQHAVKKKNLISIRKLVETMIASENTLEDDLKQVKVLLNGLQFPIVDKKRIEKDMKILGRGGNGKVFQGYFQKNESGTSKNEVALKENEDADLGLLELLIYALLQAVKDEKDAKFIIFAFGTTERPGEMLLLEKAHMDLERHVTRNMKHLPPVQAATMRYQYTIEIASGLSFLHGRGVIHGDLVPRNIMIMFDGTLKIGDFGNSFLLESAENQKEYLTTPHYAADEILALILDENQQAQYQKNNPAPFKYTIHSDGFALGGIMFFMGWFEHPNEEVFKQASRQVDRDITQGDEGVFKKYVKQYAQNVLLNGYTKQRIGPKERQQDKAYARVISHLWDVNPKKRPPLNKVRESVLKMAAQPKHS